MCDGGKMTSEAAERSKEAQAASPSIFIPTLYFAEGLPYSIVNMMSIVLFKNLGLDNSALGLYTSLLSIPWSIKFLWAPLIDKYKTRKLWIVMAQTVLAAAISLLIPALLCFCPLKVLFFIFLIIAICSATHDIAVDGYYLDALTKKEQALFVGIRNASYKVALLFGSGPLIFLAGYWAMHRQDADPARASAGLNEGWAIAFSICAAFFLLSALIHSKILTKHASTDGALQHVVDGREAAANETATGEGRKANLLRVCKAFLDQPRIAIIVLYILLFRFGDALMLKMAPAFLLDSVEKGGLQLSTKLYGEIYGTVGLVTFLLGGLFGGWLVARQGLKRCLFPTAVIQNAAILLYFYLAYQRPGLITVAVVNAIEQFAYGLGTAAYTVLLLGTVKEEYKASHYAIATALMALGLLIPGILSGYLADWLGYQSFFLVSFISSLPGIICIFYLPLNSPQFCKYADA
jgi:MFS transporter, PAT family, beta-lactamase induction signal transducer AmpG